MTSGGIVSGYSSRVRVSTGPPPEEPRSGDTPPAAAKAGRGRVRTGSSTGLAESAAPRAATDSGSLGVSAGSSSAGPTLLRTSGIREPSPDENRFVTYVCLIRGTRMLLFYTWGLR